MGLDDENTTEEKREIRIRGGKGWGKVAKEGKRGGTGRAAQQDSNKVTTRWKKKFRTNMTR
jgi:hypothetical protein